MLDTPGILWPHIESIEDGLHLAATGAMAQGSYEPIQTASFVIEVLRTRYRDLLEKRYGIDSATHDNEAIIAETGRQRGLLRKGGVVDLEASAQLVLRELQQGRLGRITLQTPPRVSDATSASPS